LGDPFLNLFINFTIDVDNSCSQHRSTCHCSARVVYRNINTHYLL